MLALTEFNDYSHPLRARAFVRTSEAALYDRMRQRAKDRAHELGMTLADVAERVPPMRESRDGKARRTGGGMSASGLSRRMRAPQGIPRDQVVALCRALECTIEYLRGETDDPSSEYATPTADEFRETYDQLGPESRHMVWGMMLALRHADAMSHAVREDRYGLGSLRSLVPSDYAEEMLADPEDLREM